VKRRVLIRRRQPRQAGGWLYLVKHTNGLRVFGSWTTDEKRAYDHLAEELALDQVTALGMATAHVVVVIDPHADIREMRARQQRRERAVLKKRMGGGA